MFVDIARRMKVDYARVDHFLNFITSLHIVQDMPFGERMLKLSTGEVIKTPNVVRMLIPERITQQYLQTCFRHLRKNGRYEEENSIH